MSFSLNEVEAAARKAVRGAGYAWGMAEEAGNAVRWLCQQQVDGCAALAALLPQVDQQDLRTCAPQINATHWRGSGAVLCPLTTGCALADLGVTDVQIYPVAVPLLMVPFVAVLAQAQDCTIALSMQQGRVLTDGDSVRMEGDVMAISDIHIQVVQAMQTTSTKASRVVPDPADWAVLNAFAHRTYAPATEESRRKGAG